MSGAQGLGHIGPVPTYELWSSDLFDRESSPSLEESSERLERALESLWRRVLEQGVQDDGQPTFTEFQLRSATGPVASIPRDPLNNPELALLRRFRGKRGFCAMLARAHQVRLGRAFDFEPFLALAPRPPACAQKVSDVLRAALSISGMLQREGTVWRAGPREDLHVLLTAAGYDGACTTWRISVTGLQFEGNPVRFGGKVEQRDSGGEAWTLECDDSKACQPLRDALFEAGL